jgi:hypothetical protein
MGFASPKAALFCFLERFFRGSNVPKFSSFESETFGNLFDL